MGHKGNSQSEQALDEDGDQKDWPAADPVEEEGSYCWYLERPHGNPEGYTMIWNHSHQVFDFCVNRAPRPSEEKTEKVASPLLARCDTSKG